MKISDPMTIFILSLICSECECGGLMPKEGNYIYNTSEVKYKWIGDVFSGLNLYSYSV